MFRKHDIVSFKKSSGNLYYGRITSINGEYVNLKLFGIKGRESVCNCVHEKKIARMCQPMNRTQYMRMGKHNQNSDQIRISSESKRIKSKEAYEKMMHTGAELSGRLISTRSGKELHYQFGPLDAANRLAILAAERQLIEAV